MRIAGAALAAVFCLSLLQSTTASAEDPACLASYRFRGGQHSEGTLETRPGRACRSTIWVSGVTTIKSIQVVQGPKNGSVSVLGTSYRFQPRSGFSGQDSMTLRINMTGSKNVPESATVKLQVSVR